MNPNLKKLRQHMKQSDISAYIITGSDPHGSEIPPARWRTREWISGFTGSAGTVVVTAERAGLWTDFRYWIQAREELRDSGIELFMEGEDGVPLPADWLASVLSPSDTAAVDGQTISISASRIYEDRLNRAGIRFRTDYPVWDELWTDRPDPPSAPVYEISEVDGGESRSGKLMRLRDSLVSESADCWVGTALDSSAWLLNIRGGDIPYNPVVTGFLIVDSEDVYWYTDETRLPDHLLMAFGEEGVTVRPYNDFETGLGAIKAGSSVYLDENLVSRAVMSNLPESVKAVFGADPVFAMKARKNSVEAGNIVRAMEKDGVAMVRFLRELEELMNRGGRITELDAAAMLLDQRRAVPGFLGESFSPIPAVGGHGAICHYEASVESADELVSGSGLFLIDSGGQWEEGTTDITRTVSLGNPTEQQRTDYTLVLKGHIALARARFPGGTRGYQLDTLARMALWQEGRNFGHGTGHGVGYRLNVHEGPQNISPRPVDVALEPGMVVSNEPGLYREGQYGIRIENLLICRNDQKTEFGSFLAFDTLTLAPYDSRLIDPRLLSDEEIRWVDEYHARVRDRLSPLLEESDRAWLVAKTVPLSRS